MRKQVSALQMVAWSQNGQLVTKWSVVGDRQLWPKGNTCLTQSAKSREHLEILEKVFIQGPFAQLYNLQNDPGIWASVQDICQGHGKVLMTID